MPEAHTCVVFFMTSFQKNLLTTRHLHDIELSCDIKIYRLLENELELKGGRTHEHRKEPGKRGMPFPG